MSQRKSPVTGDSFQALSPKYKERKVSEGLPGVPNLEESGDMLDSLDYRITSDGIEFGIFGEAALRADGHNNLSGESALPTRQFIPGEGEGFTSDIEKEVARIIADATAVSPTEAEELLDVVDSSSSLYDVLSAAFNLSSRSEIRMAVLRSVTWYETLAAKGLIKWL